MSNTITTTTTTAGDTSKKVKIHLLTHDKKIVAVAGLSQKRMDKIFIADSLLMIGLNAKRYNTERYRNWNILQHETTVSVQDEGDKSQGCVYFEESSRDSTHVRPTLGSAGASANATKQLHVSKIGIPESFKLYYELSISLPANHGWSSQVITAAAMIISGVDDMVAGILSRDEILQVVSLCDYLGVNYSC